ncbi:MAG TPA: hypothetical protein VHZ55_09375 [Bryobacteraceae bacterium]|jgi:hypothetical protein|nr:hypothetical protein [Bryobacteraceae bacterium]
MRTKEIVLSLAVSYFAVTVAARQGDSEAAKQERIAALKQSLMKNQSALKQYTWTETTQISLNGEVKKQEEKHCQYGPDGKVQKTSIGGGSESQEGQASKGGRRGGRLKKRIIEEKTGEMKDYMERVGAPVREYVPPAPEKTQAAAAAKNCSNTRPTCNHDHDQQLLEARRFGNARLRHHGTKACNLQREFVSGHSDRRSRETGGDFRPAS